MQAICGWVSNIVYYMIFVTMLINLLPGGKYEKYLKLFAGCILILLVIQPVTGGLRLDEKMASVFKSLSFENDAMELKEDLENMEGQRLDMLITQYEEAAAEDIGRMLSLEGYKEQSVSVKIEKAEDSPDFGKMKYISVVLVEDTATDNGRDTGTSEGQIALVEPVKVEVGSANPAPSSFEVSAPGKAEPEWIKKLKKEISGYYQVEERYVEIELENE